jgi:hypothetical protein
MAGMRRLTREPWFHDKRIGWGLSPAGWQGWLMTAVFIVLYVATLAGAVRMPLGARAGAGLLELVAFIVLVVMTSTWVASR